MVHGILPSKKENSCGQGRLQRGSRLEGKGIKVSAQHGQTGTGGEERPVDRERDA